MSQEPDAPLSGAQAPSGGPESEADQIGDALVARPLSESLSWRAIGRFVSMLFMLSGALVILNLPLPKPPGMERGVSLVLGVLAVVIGAVIWHLPWDRWHHSAMLLLVPAGLGLTAVFSHLGGIGGYYYSAHYVLIFIVIGVAYPQWTPIRFVPAAALAYVTPLVIENRSASDIASVAWVIPLGAIAGEALAWVAGQLRQAEVLENNRVADMGTMVEATIALAHQDDPHSVADSASRLGVKLLHGDAAIVLLTDRSGVLVGSGGFRWPRIPESVRYVRGEQALVDTVVDDAAVSSEGPETDGGLAHGLGFQAMLALPLIEAKGSFGVLLVGYRHHDGHFDQFTQNLAGTFSTQVALALGRLQAIRVLLNASLRDELTGLGNRRQVSMALDLLESGDAVVLLDFDHFKQVNDTRGHLAGDEILRRFGGYLLASMREIDMVARYGGEEFLLVLRGVGSDGQGAVERLAEEWRDVYGDITFSAGVSVHHQGSSSAETLAHADTALYQAKAAGRDCVRTYSADLAAETA